METVGKTALGKVRLKNFFMVVRFFAFSAVIFVALLFIFKTELFPFIVHRGLFLSLLAAITIFSVIFYAFIAPRTTKKSTLYINNIAWAAFLAAIIYSTGGIWSPWSIVLIFPIITTAFDLEAAAAVAIGIILIAFIGILTIFEYIGGVTGALSLGFFHIFYLGIYTFYINRIIRETLLQKYEKEETKRKYGELLEIDRAKSDFIAITSHQLRTPLTEVKWALSSIEEKQKLSAEAHSNIEKSKASIDRLVNIVNKMLVAPSLERPEAIFKKEAVYVKKLIEEIAEELAGFAKGKNVEVALVPLQSDLTIRADREKIKIALGNIIDNAIRYSPGKRVTVSSRKEGNEAIITVEDTGMGISPQDKDRIFTKFFRGKNAALLEPNETGIGLFISKTIVDKHGGTISFVSTLDQGTTFTVSLPIT